MYYANTRPSSKQIDWMMQTSFNNTLSKQNNSELVDEELHQHQPEEDDDEDFDIEDGELNEELIEEDEF